MFWSIWVAKTICQVDWHIVHLKELTLFLLCIGVRSFLYVRFFLCMRYVSMVNLVVLVLCCLSDVSFSGSVFTLCLIVW